MLKSNHCLRNGVIDVGERRYFWLKLKEDFFQDEAIEWLEEQENGKEYCLFYLKLCLKSLKDNGKLIREVGNILVPYSIEKLAEVTRSKVDTTIVAMEVLKRIGLIEILEDNTIVLPKLHDMVGSESATPSAIKKRNYRNKQKSQKLLGEKMAGDTEGTNCPQKCPTELRVKSIEYRDKSIDNYHHDDNTENPTENPTENSIQNSTDIFALWNANITPVTPLLAEKLKALVDDYGEAIVSDAIVKAVQYGKRNFAYVAAVARGLAEGSEKPQKEEMPF